MYSSKNRSVYFGLKKVNTNQCYQSYGEQSKHLSNTFLKYFDHKNVENVKNAGRENATKNFTMRENGNLNVNVSRLCRKCRRDRV